MRTARATQSISLRSYALASARRAHMFFSFCFLYWTFIVGRVATSAHVCTYTIRYQINASYRAKYGRRAGARSPTRQHPTYTLSLFVSTLRPRSTLPFASFPRLRILGLTYTISALLLRIQPRYDVSTYKRGLCKPRTIQRRVIIHPLRDCLPSSPSKFTTSTTRTLRTNTKL